MEPKDHVCEMSVKRLFEARERGCELSFIRYLEDLEERLEMLEDDKMWRKYEKYLKETFTQQPSG